MDCTGVSREKSEETILDKSYYTKYISTSHQSGLLMLSGVPVHMRISILKSKTSKKYPQLNFLESGLYLVDSIVAILSFEIFILLTVNYPYIPCVTQDS